MKATSTPSLETPDSAAAEARRVERHLRLDAEGSVVTLEEGEPCVQSTTDAAPWDWDMESVAVATRCQECGSAEKVVKEPDGRILCEACLLRGPAPAPRAVRTRQ